MTRLFDITLSTILLIVATPTMVLIGIAILLIDKQHPIYKQQRRGKDNKIFYCYKFQSLRPSTDKNYINDKKKDQERKTMLGEWLRDHSLDDLPQLVNVLKGDMTFIGPRPQPINNYEKIKEANPTLGIIIDDWYKRRAKLLPGMTGWRQIHTTGPHYLKYDLEYLDNPSVGKKLKIVILSFFIVLLGKRLYFRLRLNPKDYEIYMNPLVNNLENIL